MAHMKLLTFKQKRFIQVFCALLLAVSLANRFFKWGLLGQYDELLPYLLLLPCFALLWFWGDEMSQKGQRRLAARREDEEAAELARDKSHDTEDSERLRREIGLAPNKSLERTREG